MAKNDIILLDGILEQRVCDALPSHERDEVFEYFAFEQVLKDFDLSREEIESGWVDGRDDGGVDGFFTIVNGNLLRDPHTFAWPRRNGVLDVFVITAKHHATFQQVPLNNLLATVPELFDLGRDKSDLRGSYSDSVLHARALFHAAYRRLAPITASVSFHFVYASRGESPEVADNVKARGNQLVTLTESLFSSARASCSFVGATELVTLYRRTKTFSLTLPFLEYLSRSGDSYVVLAQLADYCRFVTDENGHLRRYLFDSNVRDYLGENRVNEDISLSLKDTGGPEFWWLNNGVTILATGATVLGKAIQLQDVQVVNGLQTSESIYNHFNSGAQDSAEKGLLVKVVVSTDSTVRDLIIRATNNQSLVEPQSLHATDKIQRDIEDVLERHGWFYERRKNYYRNIGKPQARFVTPMFVAAGFVALVLRNPNVASRLKSRFMRKPEAYNMVFSADVRLEVWPAITDVLKRAEAALEGLRPRTTKGERFLARSRNLLGLVAVARVLGTFSYSVDDLISLDKSNLTTELFVDTWNFIRSVRRTPGDWEDNWTKSMSANVCVDAARTYGLEGAQQVGVRQLPPALGHGQRPRHESFEELIERVDGVLPPQPWKPGTHFRVAKLLRAKPARVSAAIQELIRRGRWLQQRDGVVYGADGSIVKADLERVTQADSETKAKPGLDD